MMNTGTRRKSGLAYGLSIGGALALAGCGSGKNTGANGGGTTEQNSQAAKTVSAPLVFETPKPGAPLTAWTPDAARSDLLEAAHPLSDGFSDDEKMLMKSSSAKPITYTLRTPPGWVLKQLSSSLVDPTFQLQPAQQSPDAETSLIISVNTVKEGPLPTPQARLQELVKQMSSGLPLTRTPVQFGTVNGRNFVRVYGISGSAEDKHRLRNFMYVTVDAANKRTIAITGSDVEPSATKTLPLLETAARTFR